jgi:adenylate cyclase
MESSVKRSQKIKSIAIITGIGIIVGSLFTAIAFGFDTARIIKGMTAGFMITLTIGILEYFVFQNKFKKLKFSIALLIRTLCYVAAISFSVIIVWVVHESSINNANIFTTLKSNDFRYFIFEGDFKKILIFSIVVGFLINFFTQINSLLGKRVLWNYLTGKYHNPKEEERVFMFLDMSSSTSIAESLGPVTYHRFINNYFFDIDEAIVESKGEIYQYVGDEVIISWKNDSGFKNANCIKCFFDIRNKIENASDKYKKKYGLVPGFKAGLHCGEVVTGEVGDSKKEIAFHGDVLNTAARIQAECNRLGKKFLVSEYVLNKITLPSKYKIEKMGKFTLRGKEIETELYSIEL